MFSKLRIGAFQSLIEKGILVKECIGNGEAVFANQKSLIKSDGTLFSIQTIDVTHKAATATRKNTIALWVGTIVVLLVMIVQIFMAK